MKKAKPCTVCGESTTGLLFNDSWLSIPLCSKKCENEYLGTLSPFRKEQIDKIQHINDLINITKRLATVCWIIAGLGLLITVAGFFMAQAALFLGGAIPLACGAISSGHFERRLSQLRIQKRQIVI